MKEPSTRRGVRPDGAFFHWERWLFRDQVTVSASCYPHHWGLHWRENGARDHQCLDTTLVIGPWSFGLTIWNFRPIGRFLWWIPSGKRGRGYTIGWYGSNGRLTRYGK